MCVYDPVLLFEHLPQGYVEPSMQPSFQDMLRSQRQLRHLTKETERRHDWAKSAVKYKVSSN